MPETDTDMTSLRGRPGRVAAASLAWEALHSVLASRAAKDCAERLIGTRRRDGLYRFAFIIQSILSTLAFVVWYLRQPDQDLYTVRAPWSWMLRGVQLLSLGLLFTAVGVVGYPRFLGLRQIRALFSGGTLVREPEAQGPALARDGQLDVRGPFRFTRHPDNLPVFGVMWFFPRMTTNRAALAAVMSIYAILGSLHEDQRLRAAYGDAFDAYTRRVPFMWPRWPHADQKEHMNDP